MFIVFDDIKKKLYVGLDTSSRELNSIDKGNTQIKHWTPQKKHK